ncbi:MAG: death domain-associated protein [Euryarchaeota archaeon]|nr:death domain-associated protein [Euryarchaeota archaeon]
MGFGSYDESEQENQDYDTDLEDNGVDTNQNTHDGSMTFDNGASNDELLSRLEEIKDDE